MIFKVALKSTLLSIKCELSELVILHVIPEKDSPVDSLFLECSGQKRNTNGAKLASLEKKNTHKRPDITLICV